MYRVSLILYGNSQSCELAKGFLDNLMEVKRTESSKNPHEISLVLLEPIKETSLIPLLRKSGIQGFRLIEP